MSDEPLAERRNFYGRVHGKTLRASQKDYLANDLGPLTLPGVSVEANPARSRLDLGFAAGRRLEHGLGDAAQPGRGPDGRGRGAASGARLSRGLGDPDGHRFSVPAGRDPHRRAHRRAVRLGHQASTTYQY